MTRYIIGGIIGLAAGYLYYRLVGCATGTCPITANPLSSSIYGLIMGLLVAGIVSK